MIDTAAAENSASVQQESANNGATYADAILDRLAHDAHRVWLTGDSLRRAKRSLDPV